MRSCLLVFFGLLLGGGLYAQKNESREKLRAYEDTLNALGDSVMGSESFDMRIVSAYAQIIRLKKALKLDWEMKYPFDSLKTISALTSEDRAFRIFTWQCELNSGRYRHFGCVQRPNKDSLELYPLLDGSTYFEHPDDTIVTNLEWFGCIYYTIIPKRHPDQKMYYYLLGLDANDPLSTKKVIDVMYFDEHGPLFGAQVFELNRTDTIIKPVRYILEYNKNVQVGLNFDEARDKIIFDHLIPRNPLAEGVYFNYVPDGTYSGFDFRDGRWHFVDKIFHYISPEAPRPKPLFGVEEE